MDVIAARRQNRAVAIALAADPRHVELVDFVVRVDISRSAGMVMAMRMVASGLVEGPVLISITKLLHAVELPVLLVSIFKYNSLNFDKRLSSTLYLVGFACTSSVIATVLSPLAGYSYEKYGFADSYLIMGLLVFCTTFISIFLLRSNKASSDSLMSQPSTI